MTLTKKRCLEKLSKHKDSEEKVLEAKGEYLASSWIENEDRYE